jgi:hypothetical protein|tara:strand:+ start:15022 stop:15219 length:198 start_codon:yes stop_codon:yes gene_type:complete
LDIINFIEHKDLIDMMLLVSYLLLMIGMVMFVTFLQYHLKKVEQLSADVDYWREKALFLNKNRDA